MRRQFPKLMILLGVPLLFMGTLLLAGLIFYGERLGYAGGLIGEIIIGYLLVPVIITFFLSKN